MNVQDTFQHAIEEYVHMVRERWKDQVEHIILFGSVARGDAKEDSDIDLLVIVKKEDFRLRRQMISCAYDIMQERGCMISVKVLSKHDFKRMKNFSFLREVCAEGVRIA